MKAPGNTLPCILPCRELKVGIPVTDENGARLGESTQAAQQAIAQVVVSRILMAAPGMGEYDCHSSIHSRPSPSIPQTQIEQVFVHQ